MSTSKEYNLDEQEKYLELHSNLNILYSIQLLNEWQPLIENLPSVGNRHDNPAVMQQISKYFDFSQLLSKFYEKFVNEGLYPRMLDSHKLETEEENLLKLLGDKLPSVSISSDFSMVAVRLCTKDGPEFEKIEFGPEDSDACTDEIHLVRLHSNKMAANGMSNSADFTRSFMSSKSSNESRIDTSMFKWRKSIKTTVSPYAQTWTRQFAWSHDSKLVAFMAGQFHLVIADGLSSEIIFVIDFSAKVLGLQSTEKSTAGFLASNESDTPILNDGHVRSILFLDPSINGRGVHKGYRFNHELIVISSGGVLRSYLIRYHSISSSPEPLHHSVDETHSSPLDSIQLQIGCEEIIDSNPITLYHRFVFKNHSIVDCACFSSKENLLVISGVGNVGNDVKNQVEIETSPVSVWKLILKPPYYVNETCMFRGDQKIEFCLESDIHKLSLLFGRFFRKSRNNSAIKPCGKDRVFRVSVSSDLSRILTINAECIAQVWDLHKAATQNSEATNEFDIFPRLRFQLDDKVAFKNLTSGSMIVDAVWRSGNRIGLCFDSGEFQIISFDKHDNQHALLEDTNVFEFNHVLSFEHSDLFHSMDHRDYGFEINGLDWQDSYAIAKLKPNGGIAEIKMQVKDKKNPDVAPLETTSRTWTSLLQRGWTVLVEKPVGFLTSTFLWHWESNSNYNPDSSSIRIFLRKYRLVKFQESNPNQLLDLKLELCEFDAALDVAQKYGLSTDKVYKTQWLKSPVDHHLIKTCFQKVQDLDWKLTQCSIRLCNDPDTQQLLFENGLELSNILSELEYCDDGNWDEKLGKTVFTEDQLKVIRYRREILRLMDRLNTYVELKKILKQSDIIDDQLLLFKEFRKADLFQEAIKFAQMQCFEAIGCLFTYHNAETYPHILAILDSIPQTCPPEEFSSLLPRISISTEGEKKIEVWSKRSWRNRDWAESIPVLNALKIVDTGAIQSNMPEVELVEDWYCVRCKNIEKISGLIDCATQLANFGIEFGFEKTKKVKNQLDFIGSYVYDAFLRKYHIRLNELPESSWKISLLSFEKMSNDDLIKTLLARGKNTWISRGIHELFQHDLETHILPFLMNQNDDALLVALMEQLNQLFLEHFALFSKFYTSITRKKWMTQYNDQSGVLESLNELAINLCSNINKASQSEMVLEVVRHLNRLLSPDSKLSEKYTDLKTVTDLITVVKYETSVSLLPSQIFNLKNNEQAQRHLIMKISRSVKNISSKNSWNEALNLLNVLKDLQSKACPLVNETERDKIFIRAMLSSQNLDILQIAKNLLFNEEYSPMSFTDIQKNSLILMIARDYFDSAQIVKTKLEDSFEFCHHVLNLVPEKKRVIEEYSEISDEIDLYIATEKICSKYKTENNDGDRALPVEIRLNADRLHYVELLLKTPGNELVYHSKDEIMEMAQFLDKNNDELFIEAKALEYLLKASLRNNDYETSISYAENLFILMKQNGQNNEIYQLTRNIYLEIICKSDIGDEVSKKRLVNLALGFLRFEDEADETAVEKLADWWYSSINSDEILEFDFIDEEIRGALRLTAKQETNTPILAELPTKEDISEYIENILPENSNFRFSDFHLPLHDLRFYQINRMRNDFQALTDEQKNNEDERLDETPDNNFKLALQNYLLQFYCTKRFIDNEEKIFNLKLMLYLSLFNNHLQEAVVFSLNFDLDVIKSLCEIMTHQEDTKATTYRSLAFILLIWSSVKLLKGSLDASELLRCKLEDVISLGIKQAEIIKNSETKSSRDAEILKIFDSSLKTLK